MKILVTGGAGFIGSHIVDAYVSDGHDVIVLDDLSSGKRERVNSAARFHRCDIRSGEAASIIAKERPDIVNHHAAQVDVRISLESPLDDLSINVMGLVNLMEAAAKAGVKRVVLASSGGAVYGEQREYPATEQHPTLPLNPYGLNKLMSEKYLDYYCRQRGIAYLALRYSNVYGPRQVSTGEAGVVAVFAEHMLRGKQPAIYGDGCQTRDFVYVGDVVEANRIALRDDMTGAYNVSTGVETDMNALFDKLLAITGARCPQIHKPAREGEQRRSSLSSDRFMRISGWKPAVTLDDGLGRTVKWFKGSL